MNRSKFLLLFILFLNSGGYAQSGWFKTFDPGFNGKQEPIRIIEFDNGYFILLHAFSTNIPITNNGIIKFDLNGNHEWTSIATYPPESSADFLVYFPRHFTISKDSSIYFFSSSTNFNLEGEFLINKFDKTGTLIWFKTYGLSGTSITNSYLGLSLTTDSMGVVMAGRTKDDQYIVMQIDSAGTPLWKRLFDVPVMGQIGHIKPIISMPDSTFRIAYDNDVLTDFRDYLGSLDQSGNPQFFYTNPLTGRVVDLQMHPNGNLVYLSHERNPPIDEYGGIRIQMLTAQLDTLWSYLYNRIELPYPFFETGSVRNLSIAPDGKILASAYGTNYMNLVCLSENGDFLWDREIAIEGDVEEDYDRKAFDQAIWTSDGGILVAGYVYGTVNSAYASKVFLLKLDSLGCLQPGCSQTIITKTEELSDNNSCWFVSPNPASGQITGTLNRACKLENKNTTVELIDLNGRILIQQLLNVQSNFNISTESLNNGMYLIRISDGFKTSEYKKILVNKG